MRRTMVMLATMALCVSSCTLAKISGRGPVPLILNAPQQKFTVVEHFTESKRRNFDYTGAFDVAEILSARLKAHPNADAAVNVTITVSSDFGSFLIDLFTLGFANSSIFTVEGDLVKLNGNLGALPPGAQTDSLGIVHTETGLAMFRQP